MITVTADELTLESGNHSLIIERRADGRLTLHVGRERRSLALLFADSTERAQIAAFLTAIQDKVDDA